MARSFLGDYLQGNRFHLFDYPQSISALHAPVFALHPLAGFSTISMPKMTLETKELSPQTSFYKKKVVTGASVDDITLSRACSPLAMIGGNDFWNWTMRTLTGQGVFRRDLLLIQFTGVGHKEFDFADAGIVGAFGAAAMGLALGMQFAVGKGPEFAWIVPGRMWRLQRCIPTGYDPGGDLEAIGNEISLQSLTLSVETFDEISLL